MYYPTAPPSSSRTPCLSPLIELFFLFFFFFSSRRRHTRSLRDWSSDVCSSDLSSLRIARTAALLAACGVGAVVLSACKDRSEERRVGKECRSRWWPDH